MRFHEVIPEAILDHSWSIATAISDCYYHLNQGYLFYKDVHETLEKNGMTYKPDYLDQLSISYPDNLKNKEALNNSLSKATQLKMKKRKCGLSLDETIPMPFSDLGLVDYYKMAFHLFGVNIAAPYNFYFVILFGTLFLFLLNFYRSPTFLLVPIIYLTALICFMPFLSTKIIGGSLFNFRILPILAFIPISHVLLMLGRSNHSKQEIVCLSFQSIIISFLITVRSSIFWTIVACFVVLFVSSYRFIKYCGFKEWFDQNRCFIFVFFFFLMVNLFISSYKVIAFFAGFGLPSIKHYSLTLHSVLSSFVIFTVGLACNFWIVKKTEKKKISFSNFLILLSLTLILLAIQLLYTKSLLLSTEERLFFYFANWLLTITVLYLIYLIFVQLAALLNLSFRSIYESIVSHKFSSAMILLIIFLVYKTAFLSQLHPIYKSLEVAPHHLRYHNAYMALTYSPIFRREFNINLEEFQGDRFSFAKGEEDFLKKNPSATSLDFVSRFTGAYKGGLHDQLMRSAFFKFVMDHPLIFLDAEWHKIKYNITLIFNFLKEHFRVLIWPFCLCFSFFTLMQRFFNELELKRILIVFVLTISCSLIPYLYAYPDPFFGDHIIIFVSGFVFFLASFSAQCLNFALKKVVRDGRALSSRI